MINRVVLVGRLTKDIEVRYTKEQIAVASFTIALDRITSSRENKVTDFINCTAWRASAEYAAKYASKGSLVAVDGKIQTRYYEDKSGRRVSVVEVLCENFQLLEWKNKNNSGNFASNEKYVEEEIKEPEATSDLEEELDSDKFEISDDDLPF